MNTRKERLVLSSIRKLDDSFSIFDEQDKILLPLDGNPYNDALATLLPKLKLYLKADWELIALFVNDEPNDLNGFSETLKIDDDSVTSKLEAYKLAGRRPKRGEERNLRKNLYLSWARRLGANKIIFPRSLDDVLLSYLTSAFDNGRLSIPLPKEKSDRFGSTAINPFYFLNKSDIYEYLEIPSEKDPFLATIEEKYPNIRSSFVRAIKDPNGPYMPNDHLLFKNDKNDIRLKPRKANDGFTSFSFYRGADYLGRCELKIHNKHNIEVRSLMVLGDKMECYEALIAFYLKEGRPLKIYLDGSINPKSISHIDGHELKDGRTLMIYE